MEWFGDMWEVSDEMSVEVDEPYEWLDFSHIPGGQPVSDTSNLDWVHLYMSFQEDKAKAFDCGLFKGTLLCFELETVLTEDVKDLYYDLMMMFFSLTAKDEDVIHVDGHYTFINELFEDVIHYCLKGGRAVH